MGDVGASGDTDTITVTRAIKHMTEAGLSGRLSCPCGSGKSVGANAIISANASPSNRFWIARKTKKEVRETAERLKHDFRMQENDVRPVHGLDKEICVYSNKDQIKIERFYDKQHSPCNSCKNKCPFGNRFDHGLLFSSPVVVTTHAYILELARKNELPKNITLIIDEQIDRIAKYTATPDWHRNTRKALSKALKLNHHKVVCPTHAKLLQLIRRYNKEKRRESERNIIKLEQLIHQQMLFLRRDEKINKRGVTIDPTPRLEDKYGVHKQALYTWQKYMLPDVLDTVLHWIRHMEINGNNMAYADDREVVFTKDRMGWIDETLGVKCLIVLDGSASLDVAHYDELPLVQVPLVERKYKKTILHILPVLPTRKNAVKYRNQILDYAHNLPYKKPCLITNAKPTLEEIQWLEDHEDDDPVHLTNGQGARGSNEARTCDMVCITSSLFTSVSDIATTTAAATGEEIDASRIWERDKPKMRGTGFVDPELAETTTRRNVDLAQQAMHRGIIRQDHESDYNVVITVGCWKDLAEILRQLPADEIEIIEPDDRKINISISTFSKIWNEKKLMIDGKKEAKYMMMEIAGRSLAGKEIKELGLILAAITALSGVKFP